MVFFHLEDPEIEGTFLLLDEPSVTGLPILLWMCYGEGGTYYHLQCGL
jgi:hypothetical protein